MRARAEEKARIGNYKESKKAGEEARKKQEEEDKEDAKPRVLFSPLTTQWVSKEIPTEIPVQISLGTMSFCCTEQLFCLMATGSSKEISSQHPAEISVSTSLYCIIALCKAMSLYCKEQ